MYEHNLSYREVIPDQTAPSTWREINVNTGGTQSTLQDIKVAERANGFSYRDSSKYFTRNRFIYWRINNDILELVEQSLDVNLSGNRLRYKFIDTPILDGITIHENYANIIILVPTVSSVHQLIFPHPNRLHKQDDLLETHPDLSVPSIFSETTSSQCKNYFSIFHSPSSVNAQLPHIAASWFTLEEEAKFLLAYPTGELILVSQDHNGESETIELKYESIMPKFFSGMFRSKNNDANVIDSMILHTIGLETYAITLCRDGQLRVWSCSKAMCIAVSDILLESMSGNHLNQGESHILRKVVGGDTTEFIFAVFLRLSGNSCFHILKPVINGTQFGIMQVYNIDAPGDDLIDFSFTPTRIWSVWKDIDWVVYTATFAGEQDNHTAWVPVTLDTLPNPDELSADDGTDPRQVYMNYIFHPGRFSLQIISKALSIYKRSVVTSDLNVSASVLRQRVAMAVEHEIQARLQEVEVADEDEFLEDVKWCWSNFYSGCVQFHVAGLRPLGILLLPSVSGAVLLKKSAYSILRPLDLLEHLMLCSEYLSVDALSGYSQLSITTEEYNDIIVLTKVLVFLEDQLNDIFKTNFNVEMAQSVSPSDALMETISEITMDDGFVSSIKDQLAQCSDLYRATHTLLELLRMDQPIPENHTPRKLKSSIMHLFSSQLGLSVINQCFFQQTSIKFTMCRNLLLLQHILINESSNDAKLESLRSVCMPDVVILLQSYFALHWLSQLTASTILPLESQQQRLSLLKLAPVFNLKTNTQQIISLVELYAGSSGGSEAHKALMKFDFDEDTLAHWHTALLPYLTQFTLIIWPINGTTSFTEWLLSSGQHLHLQQYVTMISSWCDWNNLTRMFLLAVSFLSTGENHKAFDYFIKASEDIHSEQFLIDRLDNAEGPKALLLYFLKVIQLFELHSALDYAIETADAAFSAALNDNEPLKATLYSSKFKHHLLLGHVEDAFQALSSNPDPERKKDNLRDLVKTLLDNKALSILMSFDYSGMEDLFFSILYTRARATDSVNNIYYDFLYSYCVRKSFYRLAGSVTYEQAYRLNQHDTLEALEKQVKCYLASVNALCLAGDKFTWILKPADPDLEEEVHVLPTKAGNDDQEAQIIKFKKEVEVIDLVTVRKELVFTKARLQLARLDSNSIYNYGITTKELVVFLASAGLFKTAFNVCKTFELSCDIVFELLTHQCVTLMDDEGTEAWNWLLENDLNDLEHVPNSPASVAWTLVQKFLDEYEDEHLTQYHRVVAEKILQMGGYLPYWLLASYKVRNPAELLRLYYFNGFLNDAYSFAMDYLKAALGYGPEYFGLEHTITPLSKPLCMPVNIIDALVYELKLQNEKDPKKPFEKQYEYLKDLFVKYLDTSTRISYDVCRDKMQTRAAFT